MRLKLVRVEGYKRFAQPSALDTRGRVIAIVGPNEAGKTSLLRAMTHISTLTAFDINELTDRDVRAADSRVIEAHFSLEDGDRDQLGTLVPAGTDLTYTRVVYVNGGARYRLSPAIQRDRALRTRAGKALATAVERGGSRRSTTPASRRTTPRRWSTAPALWRLGLRPPTTGWPATSPRNSARSPRPSTPTFPRAR